MKIAGELLCRDLGRAIIDHFNAVEIDYNSIVQTKALNALEEIKKIIHNNQLDDFMMIEKIISVFEKYDISTGGCHDF